MVKNKEDIRFSSICLLGFEISSLTRLIVGAVIVGILAAIFGAQVIALSHEALFQFIRFLAGIQCAILAASLIASFASHHCEKYSEVILAFRLILPAPLLCACLAAQLTAWSMTGFSTAYGSTLFYLAISVFMTLIHIRMAWEAIEVIKNWLREIVWKRVKGEQK